MYINSVISYLGAWEELQEKYREEYLDIFNAIECLDSEFNQNLKIQTNKQGIITKQWIEFLITHGWNSLDNFLLDFTKYGTKASLYIGSDQQIVNRWTFTECNIAIKNEECEIPILVVPMKEAKRNWKGEIDQPCIFDTAKALFNDLSPLYLNYPFIILGISEHETPVKIINIPSNLEGKRPNVVMDRSIEFPPEYYQAGLGILSYFHKVLKAKYPGVQATVKISQEDLVVRMIVETEDGDRHIVEKALEEYDLIIRGEIRPEEYFDPSEQKQIYELRNELKIADVRIEYQKLWLASEQRQIALQQKLSVFQQKQLAQQIHLVVQQNLIMEQQNLIKTQENQIKTQENQIKTQENQIMTLEVEKRTFKDILSQVFLNPSPPVINVNVSPEIKINNNLNQQNIIHNDLKETIDAVRNLKEAIDSPEAVESLNEVEEALSEADENNINNAAGVSKLQKFLEKVNNIESTVGKSIATTTAGVGLIKNLTRCYNKIAPLCGLPEIPL